MTSAVKPPATSYCVECDAAPGECSHAGARYLEEVVYQSVDRNLAYRRHHGLEPLRESKTNREVGFRVPKHERQRWDNPVLGVMRVKPEQRKAKPIQQLIVELEDWVFLSDFLEQTLRACYDVSPTKVMVLVESTVKAASAGRLNNPGGYLASKLAQVNLTNGNADTD